jgi:uncharacterized protein
VIRAVIDTNVVVSGLIKPAGNEALVLLAVHQGLIQPCVSEDILEEYADVLRRPKFGFPADAVAASMKMFRRRSIVSSRRAITEQSSPDPDDAMFIQCAADTKAEYIITGNKRHFPKPIYGSAESLAPPRCMILFRAKSDFSGSRTGSNAERRRRSPAVRSVRKTIIHCDHFVSLGARRSRCSETCAAGRTQVCRIRPILWHPASTCNPGVDSWGMTQRNSRLTPHGASRISIRITI